MENVEFRSITIFKDPTNTPVGSTQPHVELLAQSSAEGQIADCFRLHTSAAASFSLRFKAAHLLQHQQLHRYTFSWDIDVNSLSWPLNRFSTPWENLTDLVRGGKVMVLDDPDAEEVETSFLTWWEARAKDACAPAGAVRWAIVAEDDGTLELQLQGKKEKIKSNIGFSNMLCCNLKCTYAIAGLFGKCLFTTQFVRGFSLCKHV
jgi:hypothetical protein